MSRFINWCEKYKGIVAMFILISLFLSPGNTDHVHAATTTPDGGRIGSGGAGSWNSAAIMVKADFFSPSKYGLLGDSESENDPKYYKNAFKTMFPDIKETDDNFPKSLDEMTVFLKGSGMKGPALDALAVTTGGKDSKALSQMYLYGNYGYRSLRFNVGNNYYSTFESTGHKGVSAKSMSMSDTEGYKSTNGILSVNSVYMKELLKVTNNGKDKWDGELIAKTIEDLWNTYVNPNSSKYKKDDATAIRYRQEFASMFYDSGSGTANWTAASAYLDTAFDTNIKAGKTPPGASFKLEDGEAGDLQARKIRNLLMASLGLVMGDPVGGTTISPQGKIDPKTSYKGDTLLKNMGIWARAGANGDDSDTHFAIKLEVYGLRGANDGTNVVTRWDQSFLGASNGGILSNFSMPSRPTLSKTNIDRYGLENKYALASNGFNNNKVLTQAIIDNHKTSGQKVARKSSSGEDVDAWTVFQKPYLSTGGTVTIPSSSAPGYSYRNIVQMTSPIYYNGQRTMNIGYGYISPDAGFEPEENKPGTSTRPNLVQDSELKSDLKTVKVGEKVWVDSFTGYRWEPPMSEDAKSEYSLKWKDEDWVSRNDELSSMLKLIERASTPSEINAGDPNAKIPVTITIKRTITNGTDTSGKMFDNPYTSTTEVQNSPGNHHFKIVDNGDTATITFNLIADGKGTYEKAEYRFKSPLKLAEGKTGDDAVVTINNDAVATLMQDASSRIKFRDTGIQVSSSPNVTTTVKYTYQMSLKTPNFKENTKVYGDAETDLMRKKTSYTAVGWKSLPENGAVYPASDWKSGDGGYVRSDIIQREISFVSVDDKVPFYSNLGYDEESPYYSEIKQGGPTNESFEAMAGTPTTRDLYMSVSGTDFRVSFTAKSAPTTNPLSERIYRYVVNVTDCWEQNVKCTTYCPGHNYGYHGSDGTDSEGNPIPCTHWEYPPGASCGMGKTPACTWYTGSGCECSGTTNQSHPDSHVWTYNVHVPIEAFTYFDMDNSEVWRLTQWGLKGGESFLTNPNPTYDMATKIWGYDKGNYSSMSGRLLFSEAQNSNEQGANAKFGDNTTTFNVSSGLREDLKNQAVDLANNAKNGESAMKATIVSDYIVMKTSEGYQSPYFFTQEMDTTAAPSSAPDFSGEGGDSTTTDRLKVNKQLTMDDFWWKNSDKATAATPDNGWTKTSITYGGYNGNYSNLSSKYINEKHKSFLNSSNPLEEALTKYGLTVSQSYPNQDTDGSGTTSMGQNAGNLDHIKTALDVVDTTPNGEYDTGKSWVRYDRIMFYQNNADKGAKSSTAGKFEITGAGVWENKNVPYYDGAEKVNDIVIQDPVSAEYAIVVSNPEKYDTRTNAKLLQGGDPLGVLMGICPGIGCIYSTLTCTTPLTAHTEACYEIIQGATRHVGGLNAHVHTADEYHVHTAACYEKVYYVTHGSGCTYEGETHVSTRADMCTQCGHAHPGEDRIVEGSANGGNPICGHTEGELICTNELNTHVDTPECETTYTKVLTCTDPHHYVPGEPTDHNDPAHHYELGDPRCWTPCGDDSRHSTPLNVTLPDGSSARMGGTFINLDREFQIYYPFRGDFAKSPSLSGIAQTTVVRGKGYINGMDTREWTDHRWVNFPFNVIDKNNQMILAYTNIDLNEYSTVDETFNFYLVMANDERSEAPVKFTSTAINAPVEDRNAYFDESTDVTNKERVDYKYAARHTGAKTHFIDVVGSIGALTLHDTGDYRFSNLFKQAKSDGSYLVPNLVPEVNLNRPNYIVSDNITSRLDPMTKLTSWLDTYSNLFNPEGGKSGGTGNAKEPLLLPLVPRYNNIPALRNQPMRPGYQLYMDSETIGNYYGETMAEESKSFLDNQMVEKMQVRPMYYSMNLDTGEYIPVDAYYGVNGEYMKVYDHAFDGTDDVGVQNHYLYLDWLNESARRNYTTGEKDATAKAKAYREEEVYGGDVTVRVPTVERDVIGSSNVLFLNDLNRTFIGSSDTYGVDKNPGDLLDSRWYNMQSQRWHFTLGLPSSVVFVEKGKPITEANIAALQTKDRVIVGALDIKVLGDVWTLQYDGKTMNSNGFQIFEGGKTYQPPKFDENGNPTNDPEKDVTSDDPIVVVYPPDKTSKDDVQSNMTH